MSDEIYYNLLFPSLVVYKDFGSIEQSIVDQSKKILKTYNDKPFNCPCLSTVSTYSNVLDLPEFDIIKKQIVQTIEFYCDFMKINKNNLYFSDSWLNLYDEHGYQDLHAHSDSLLSGVYYLQSSGEKDLIFQAPYHFFQAINPKYDEINLTNCHSADYNSTEGRCVVFMSHLMHRTLPATKERISLSFNIKYKNVQSQ